MTDYKLGAVESRFADIIWSNEPMTTGELIKLCEKELNWKRTTTYTVLKKLSEHGIQRGILCAAERTVCGGNVSGFSSCFYCRFHKAQVADRTGNCRDTGNDR